jgi:hypothetical protein
MSINSPEHIAQALAQIQNRPPPPEIDYTQHILDDGTAISTQERVVKDVSPILLSQACFRPLGARMPMHRRSGLAASKTASHGCFLRREDPPIAVAMVADAAL